jgi:transcriptional regulator with XRE-family HTH domain
MLAKQVLAKRLRETRQRQHMTLKDVERLSGFSSTHISEIERGRTSPTVKALMRIAGALSKDPCYFVEGRELDDVALATVDQEMRPAQGIDLRSLSDGILGSRLKAYQVRAQGEARDTLDAWVGCDACLYAIAGVARLQWGNEEISLRAGESLHARFTAPPTLVVEEGPVELFAALHPDSGLGSGRRVP